MTFENEIKLVKSSSIVKSIIVLMQIHDKSFGSTDNEINIKFLKESIVMIDEVLEGEKSGTTIITDS